MTRTKTRTIRKTMPPDSIKATITSAAKSNPPPHNPAVASPKAATSNIQPQSKQDRVLGLLRRKEGATVAAIMKVTGWQQHSVRGFLAGVVRKKFKLHLTARDDDNGKRVYRITGGKPQKPPARAAR